ncbi:hypothetical protein K469DRAFT_752766 [Zopfia rhizophila CBS 207.26]|uniref:Uncharacterized protein n=1 Tax=Zopfia rhizophila CBS 207.26 TaxID=1314779 RepID=A0A6A6DPP6_9PEZI|nr:hypothetical protein K469DRAFT_752766 [Zopfia rhizophila CBS 207.26]
MASRDMLRIPATRGRLASPALSDVSELTVLSRTPSPPPVFQTCDSPSTLSPRKRGMDGRFVSASPKRSASPMERLAKKLRSPQKTPTKRTSPKKSPYDDSPTKPVSRKRFPSKIVRGEGGFGILGRFPREIRELIYAAGLNIVQPVSAKECCGPTSTRRERDACQKHGNTSCKMLGKWNGLWAGISKQHFGRFNIFLVSRAIKEEAAWVLFNQGSLLIKINESVAKYLGGCRARTTHRLQDLPNNEHARNVWMMAASFRDVRIEIPAATIQFEHPLVYTARLGEAVSLLLKAWELQPDQPTSEVPHTVTVHLGRLYNETIPFNTSSSPEDVSEWALIHYPFYTPGLEKGGEEASHNLDKMVATAMRHRDGSEWKVVAFPETKVEDEGEKEGDMWLSDLEASWEEHNVEFQCVA